MAFLCSIANPSAASAFTTTASSLFPPLSHHCTTSPFSLFFTTSTTASTPFSTNLRFRFSSTRTRSRAKWSNLNTRCSAAAAAKDAGLVKDKSVSVILLAGGKGKRMGATMPKQYLPLLGRPIALYSLSTFSLMVEVMEVVVVCDTSYKDIFEDAMKEIDVNIKFALPGKERQDSVYSGLQVIDSSSELVCVHDSARPLVSTADVAKVFRDGWQHGAAVLGVPVKATIKEGNNNGFVVKTLDRKTLWEIQTPQVMKPDLLKKGFDLVNREGLEVTDDVSIIEHLKHPVYITEGSYTNIKVTTPDDLLLADRILSLKS